MDETPTRICDLIVGLGHVEIVSADDLRRRAVGAAHSDSALAGL